MNLSETNKQTLDLIISQLPGTVRQVSRKTKLHKSTVIRWLNKAVELKLVHVAKLSFTPNGGALQQHFAKGDGLPLTVKPVPKSGKQRTRKYRSIKSKAEKAEEKEFAEARKKALTNKPAPDILALHLFGKINHENEC